MRPLLNTFGWKARGMAPLLTVPGRRGDFRKGHTGPGGGWASAGRACRTGLTSEARLVGVHVDKVPPAVVCGGEHPEAAVVVEPGGGVKALVDVEDRRLVCEQLARALAEVADVTTAK